MEKRLAQEKRVAFGLGSEHRRELFWHVVLSHSFEVCVHVRDIEPRQHHAGRFHLALQQGECLGERMATIDVRLAVRADYEHPGASRSTAEGAQHADGRVVAPMQIVDHQRNGRRAAQAQQHLADRVMQPRRLGVGRHTERLSYIGQRVGDCGNHAGHDRRFLAKHLGEGLDR